MDVIEAIETRKSVRAFKPDQVPKEVLAKILEVSVRAPSTDNTQPWEFTVVTGPVLDELKKGTDFAELAKKNSIDPTAAKGGRLELMDGREWLPRGSFEKGFEHVLFGIDKGRIGGPVKSQFGWHILKVEDRRQPETPAFVQVRGYIKNRLQDQKNAELHKKLTEEAKKSVPVVLK